MNCPRMGKLICYQKILYTFMIAGYRMRDNILL